MELEKNKQWRFGLRKQLLLGVLLLMIIPNISGGVWVNYRVNQALSLQAVRENTQVSDNISLQIDKFLAIHRENLLSSTAVGDWTDPAARQQQMEGLHQALNGWSQLEYWDVQTGKLLLSVPHETNVMPNVQGEPWFQHSLNQKGVVIDNISDNVSPAADGLLFTLSIRDSSGRIKGVLAARIPQDVLHSELKNFIFLTSETRVWLVDHQNRFVFEPQAFPGEPERYTPEFLHSLQQTQLIAERTLSDTGWTLIVARDRQAALGYAWQITKEIGYITGGILLAALFLARWYIGWILYPVRKILEQIRALSKGYNVRDLPPLPERRDEIGEVANAFRNLAVQTQEMSRELILVLVAALEARDSYTKHHSERVAAYAQLLARQLQIDPLKRANIARAGILHDIGKIGVPEDILTKPGRLTPEERQKMQNHPQYSFDIIREVPTYAQAGITEAVLQHHERWDGQGYPQGLIGEDICIEAQILAVSDAFDAMTSNRVYRRALSLEQALAEVERGAGSQFSPDCAQAFLQVPIEELRDCLNASQLSSVPVAEVS